VGKKIPSPFLPKPKGEIRGRKSEGRNQRSEIRDQRSEGRDQGSEVGGLRLEAGERTREDGRGKMDEKPMRPVVPHPSEAVSLLPSVSPQTSSEAILKPNAAAGDSRRSEGYIQYQNLMNTLTETTKATADAHQAFLDFSNELTQSFEKTFTTQARLLESLIANKSLQTQDGLPGLTQRKTTQQPIEPAFDRGMCMEFAIGSVAKVLGPEFNVVDTHNVRVRLPDEPLMLVDRILSVQGEKQSMGSGRVVTEHDVLLDAWYLDGDRAPVCISVEAGQADLFLCSYLGIDHAVKGKRSYRLLDAKVKFLRGLPQPGDVIRYEIEIDHFSRQGETYLFFFSFEGYINDSHLISMTSGCAGFFTEEEVRTSGGIILTAEDTQSLPGQKPSDWKDLVPLKTENYDDAALESLRQGDLAECFGPDFMGIQLAESLRLPDGRMKLIHRILKLDPKGGRYGLGRIRAEADIHPDDWFLTCHFMDDMVMPGTLMYECCAHTLRVFIQRIGWVTAKTGVCYEPVVGVQSVLKCRGPVTPKTSKVWYDIEIKEIGYAPEPYVIADALMVADGHRIVSFKDMSMKMTGITRDEIESLWENIDRGQRSEVRGRRQINRKLKLPERSDAFNHQSTIINHHSRSRAILKPNAAVPKDSEFLRKGDGRRSGVRDQKTPLYDRDKILSFAIGKPSEAFGEPYKMFDNDRVIARLPGPPYSFLDRIVAVEPEAWILKPDGWIEAEYDMLPDAWYFKADRSFSMPFCVLLEVALQPCGWLAAYSGSALKSENDLKFRNLGGNAVLHRMIFPEEKKLTIRARMTKVSEAAEMIIEHFDFMVLQDTETIYSGDTNFGFFTKQALAQQVGIRNAEKTAYTLSPNELQHSRSFIFDDAAPLFPEDTDMDPASSLAMPAKALRMIDRIDAYVPNGGPQGLGYIRGVKKVDPDEWFFKAHFFQDPVCPGSLGIESFLQLIKFAAMNQWPHLAETHRFEWIMDEPHSWSYRGQVIPENKAIEVDAVITKMIDTPVPTLYANGFLKVDGLYIYQMENFGFRLIPK
jgi:3-hydroxymyristoyl/3-hydroxydecanoyl-(acyl carrier protein) dehydratase